MIEIASLAHQFTKVLSASERVTSPSPNRVSVPIKALGTPAVSSTRANRQSSLESPSLGLIRPGLSVL
jgi:hypothetical protein